MLKAYFLIALGGGVGSVARFACAEATAAWLGTAFPWGTLAVNLAGSLAIGAFAALWAPGARGASPDLAWLLMAGFCGGFTTFSAFSLQTLQLLQSGEVSRAGANVAGSVVLCVLATWAGWAAASALNGPAR